MKDNFHLVMEAKICFKVALFYIYTLKKKYFLFSLRKKVWMNIRNCQHIYNLCLFKKAMDVLLLIFQTFMSPTWWNLMMEVFLSNTCNLYYPLWVIFWRWPDERPRKVILYSSHDGAKWRKGASWGHRWGEEGNRGIERKERHIQRGNTWDFFYLK